MPANAPLAPIVIARRSWSLPTHAMTKSWPSAAACGVGAVCPPNFSAQALALAGVRLKTVTWWPPLAMSLTLGFLPADLDGPAECWRRDGARSGLETGPSQGAEPATLDPAS